MHVYVWEYVKERESLRKVAGERDNKCINCWFMFASMGVWFNESGSERYA